MEKLVIEEKYSYYEYQIWTYHTDDHPDNEYYVYKITDKGGGKHYWTGCPVIRESDEYYDTPDEARFSAKEHIDSLESGEG